MFEPSGCERKASDAGRILATCSVSWKQQRLYAGACDLVNNASARVSRLLFVASRTRRDGGKSDLPTLWELLEM